MTICFFFTGSGAALGDSDIDGNIPWVDLTRKGRVIFFPNVICSAYIRCTLTRVVVGVLRGGFGQNASKRTRKRAINA